MLHVLFQVAGVDYVLPALDVVQMETYSGATKVPGTPPHVAGLVQLRGRVVPVVDVRVRFGAGAAERTPDARVIVVREGDRHVALLVDRAREVLELAPDDFRAPPDLVVDQAAGFVRGMAQRGARVFMLVDVGRIVGADPLVREETHAERPN
jgi:purine-binding chemotaxis protein CheW